MADFLSYLFSGPTQDYKQESATCAIDDVVKSVRSASSLMSSTRGFGLGVERALGIALASDAVSTTDDERAGDATVGI